jgi:hypothetical protein
MRCVHEAVEDGIGDCWIDDHFVPVIDGETTKRGLAWPSTCSARCSSHRIISVTPRRLSSSCTFVQSGSRFVDGGSTVAPPRGVWRRESCWDFSGFRAAAGSEDGICLLSLTRASAAVNCQRPARHRADALWTRAPETRHCDLRRAKARRAGYRISRGPDGGRSSDRGPDRMGRWIGCHRDRPARATIPQPPPIQSVTRPRRMPSRRIEWRSRVVRTAPVAPIG